jgi:hypothetical protein
MKEIAKPAQSLGSPQAASAAEPQPKKKKNLYRRTRNTLVRSWLADASEERQNPADEHAREQGIDGSNLRS